MNNSEGQLVFNLPYGNSSTARDFFVAASNASAVGWLERYPNWPAAGLVMYGPKGVGKTHLARAWCDRVTGIRIEHRSDAQEYLAADCLQPVVVDSADVICADEAGAEAVFHIYQRLAASPAKMLLLANSPPQAWFMALPDLKSRVLALPTVEVTQPDDALCEALMVKYLADRGVGVAPEVLAYLQVRLPRDAEQLEKAMQALDLYALTQKKPISLPLARQWLQQWA